ncbi:hypothetical protein [Tardiphaga sp. P9-11]|jgi:hypothetical protein|uniref:hypothetical protein n=1 Tax=Tardiphaga sp. P9-11 TaxID=2024614 RepID=UPI0011F1FB38|nr:hypothetical protein [Tardiphaga sp. P9-11]KAA0073999.1 hypothetical protein CIW50_18895 [Tardiphaga sp. P9-11]
MQNGTFQPIRNSDLPAMFRRIRLELARNTEHPEGSSEIGYVLLAPLDSGERIDATAWKSHREACRVTRLRPGGDDIRGHLVHRPGGSWAFHYDVAGAAPDEAGFHFESEAFRPGEYVSLREANATHTYRVASVTPL